MSQKPPRNGWKPTKPLKEYTLKDLEKLKGLYVLERLQEANNEAMGDLQEDRSEENAGAVHGNILSKDVVSELNTRIDKARKDKAKPDKKKEESDKTLAWYKEYIKSPAYEESVANHNKAIADAKEDKRKKAAENRKAREAASARAAAKKAEKAAKNAAKEAAAAKEGGGTRRRRGTRRTRRRTHSTRRR